MALLSLVISAPLHSARNFTRLYNGLLSVVGIVTVVIGGSLIYGNILLVSLS